MQVQTKVEEGFRLPQPQGCPEDLYHLMQLCWARRPTNRPHFSDVLKNHLEPLAVKLARYGRGGGEEGGGEGEGGGEARGGKVEEEEEGKGREGKLGEGK